MNKAIIIGGGITGAFTALELAKSSIETMLIEKSPEPAFGTTNANSGIVHSSHNTQQDTLKFTLVDSGNAEIKRLSKILNFGFLQCGEIVVIQDESQMEQLKVMRDLAIKQNLDIQMLNAEELKQHEPNVTGYAGLLVKDAGVVNPYEMCQSVWNTAERNGVVGKFSEQVISIEKKDQIWLVKTNKAEYEAQYVINCAGLYAGEISKMALKDKNRVNIQPRKGEEYLLDKDFKGLINSIIFPLPNGNSKGTLVIPTVDGTIMVGPTAVQCEERDSRPTTVEGMQKVFQEARKLVPSLNEATVIASFTGIRAADEKGDFIVENIDNFINIAGIQSPGLTAAPMLGKMGADFITKDRSKEIVYVPLHTKLMNGDKNQLMQQDGNHSKIVCGCECVSLADVHNAITDGARTVDGIKTRTRAGMGRCQGGFCTGTLVDILSQRLNVNKNSICKNEQGTNIIINEIDKEQNVQEIEDMIPYQAQNLNEMQIALKSNKKDEIIEKIKTSPSFDVVVLGAGPAGLAAAQAASTLGKSVLVLEKSNRTGGILIQCIHDGFGLQKYQKELTGPEYAELLEADCLASNANILLHSFITGCTKTETGYNINTITRGLGVITFQAKSLISCMGCRERSRVGVRIQGTRPAGLYTAGLAQQMINMQGQLPGKRIIILGSGDIGLIMARRCTLEGAKVLGVYELLPRCSGLQRNVEQCLHDFGIPLTLSKTVVNVIGDKRVEAVELAPVDPITLRPDLTQIERIECDCLLLSVGLIPQAKVSVTLGGKVNQKTRLIEVDSLKRVKDTFFTAGNCLQVHDLADDAAKEGEEAGKAAAMILEQSFNGKQFNVIPDENILFYVPNTVMQELETQNISVRVNKIIGHCKVIAKIGEQIIGETEIEHAVPAEMIHIKLDSQVNGDVKLYIEKLEEVEVDKSLRQMICIVCPNGCNLSIKLGANNDIEEITGNQCKAGINYAKQELIEPFRVFSTSIPITGAEFSRLPVKLSKPIPRTKLVEAARKIREIVVQAPIAMGDVVIKNIFGAKVTACCSAQEKK